MTSPAVLLNNASITEGKGDMRSRTRYQSICLRGRELPLAENKLTLCMKLSPSVLNAESVSSLDSSKVSKDYQTDIQVSYECIVSAGEGFRMGKTQRERHLTFPALQRMQ